MIELFSFHFSFFLLVFLLVFFFLFFLRFRFFVGFFFLGVAIRELVVYEVVQCNYRTYQCGEVDDEHLIVRLYVQGINERCLSHVGKEIENVLKLVDDLVVYRELAATDLKFLRNFWKLKKN